MTQPQQPVGASHLGFVDADENGQVIFSIARPEGRCDILIASVSSGRFLVQEPIPRSLLDSLDEDMQDDYIVDVQARLMQRLAALKPARRRYVRTPVTDIRQGTAC